MTNSNTLEIVALQGFPMIQAGDDLISIIIEALEQNQIQLSEGDAVVVAQKVVSKAEGRTVALSSVFPSDHGQAVAADCEKDSRLVELILGESTDIVKCVPGVLIVRHKLGFVMANAGIDQSNVEGEGEVALLLPVDPDGSARKIKQNLDATMNVNVAVVINDSFGRPFRRGTAGVCIGAAGFAPLDIQTGSEDLFGRELLHTEVAIGDEIAAAASLLMGQAAEATPVVVIRGLNAAESNDTAQTLIRPVNKDLFL